MDKIDTIIWDWNGTLFNDIDICINSINQLLTKRKLPVISKEYYLEVFDFPVQHYYQRIGFDFEKEPFEIPANQFIENYFSQIGKAELHKPAHDVLQYFAEKGYRQLILSAAEQEKLKELLVRFKIESFFESVQGLKDDFATSKVELGISMLNELCIIPSNACLIGDTTHDYEVGNAIGCHTILIANGHHPRSKLEKTGVKVIADLSDLINLF